MDITDIQLTYGDKKRSLIETAALIAYTAHSQQKRKDDGSPYVIHPIMVGFLLTRHGFSETVAAAGIVHDVLEDTTVNAAQLERLLGHEIVELVQTVSENTSLPWEERKQQYIDTIHNASTDVKAISIADKIHNLESLLSAHAKYGPDTWNIFNRGRDKKIWFERSLLAAVQTTWKHPLIDEYAQLVTRMEALD